MKRHFLSLVLLACLSASPLFAQTKQPTLPTGTMNRDEWLRFHTAPLQPGEIDRLVSAELSKINIKPAPLQSDEQFVRRVYLDLVGRLPMPADISEFQANKHPNKRAQLVDQLLESEDYAKHWTLYWRNVIQSRTTDFRVLLVQKNFDEWMTEQFRKNSSWAKITREVLTAAGEIRNDTPDKNGQGFFLASRTGADAVTEQAAETSRIFLGIQIQCAQCHDHPSDVWKREDFHHFAAYFARVRERPLRDGMKFVGTQLVSIPFGEHQMASADNPRKTSSMHPKFLEAARESGRYMTDQQRRRNLADQIVSKDNPWFAGAFVNRLWGELMGQAFYSPIDDLGPQKEATMPAVLGRVAAAFRGSDYDIKGLFRDICNSEMYQRVSRPGESAEQHLFFAANHPTRLSADALWHSLVDTLGKLDGGFGRFPGPGGFGPRGGFGGLEGQFKAEFKFDPSTKPEEVEGSISQALILMNNPVLQQKIQATGSNLLARILESYPDNDDAIRMVYLRALARRPTDRELSRCREHVAQTTRRSEAFEDILWALINSTEYQTKR